MITLITTGLLGELLYVSRGEGPGLVGQDSVYLTNNEKKIIIKGWFFSYLNKIYSVNNIPNLLYTNRILLSLDFRKAFDSNIIGRSVLKRIL